MAFMDVSYAAGRVFYDGFESGSYAAGWQTDPPNAVPVVVTASVDGVAGPYAGTHMLKMNFNATGSNLFTTIKLLPIANYTDEVFIRVHYRLDRNIVLDENNVFKLLRFFQASGSLYHDMFDVAGHNQASFTNAGNANINTLMPTYWGGASGDNTNQCCTLHTYTLGSGTITNTFWHVTEYYVKMSTGQFKVWHDGIQVRNDSGLDFQGVKWTDFYLGSNGVTGGNATNTWYVDEFEVYTDQGTGGSGLMSDATITGGGSGDTTPPAAPVNLRIQ